MSQAEELLDSIEEETYTAGAGDKERHIVIGRDRKITVPEELQKIAVQFDHNVETLTFDCPRYWDKHDMSTMTVYINFMREDGYIDKTIATNVIPDETDDQIMHFDWTVKGQATQVKGVLRFLVCVKKTDAAGNEETHWNSELCEDTYVVEGMECDTALVTQYPDIITDLLTRMEKCEAVLDMSWVTVTDKEIADIKDGTTVVGKTKADQNGNVIDETYATKIESENGDAQLEESKVNRAGDTITGELTVEGALTLPNSINDLEETEVSAGYSSRQTAGGLSIVNDSFTEVKKIEGKTVKTTNLLPYPYAYTTRTLSGITFTDNGDGSITVDGTATANVEFVFRYIPCSTMKAGGAYVYSFEGQEANRILPVTAVCEASQTWVKNLNSPGIVIEKEYIDNNYYIRPAIYVFSGQTFDNFKVYPMLNEGSTALPYVPYFSGLKHACVNSIKSTGRNLLNLPEEFTFTKASSHLKIALPAGPYTVDFGEVEYGGSNPPAVEFKNLDTGFMTGWMLDDTNHHKKVNLTEGNYRIIFYSNGWSYGGSEGIEATIKKVMLSHGSNELPYEPYKEDIFQLPETVECGLGVVIDPDKRKILDYSVDIMLTGAEDWSYASYTQNGVYYSTVYVYDLMPSREERVTNGICTDGELPGPVYGDGIWWIGANNAVLYWVGVGRYLKLTDDWADPISPTEEEIETMLLDFKAYLTKRYNDGDPVRIRYISSTVQRESDIDILAGYEAWNGGSEVVAQGDEDNSKWGAVPTITQSYMLDENPEEAATKGYVRNAVAEKVDEELFDSVMDSLRETDYRHQTAIEGLEAKAQSFDNSITRLDNKVNDIDIGQLPEVKHNISAIEDGTTVVGKAEADAEGNVITDTYATKAALSEANSNIEILDGRVEALEQAEKDDHAASADYAEEAGYAEVADSANAAKRILPDAFNVLVNNPSELQASGVDYVLVQAEEYEEGVFNGLKHGDIVYIEGVNGYGEIVRPFCDQDTEEKLEEYLRTENFIGINHVPNTDFASYMAELADGSTDVEIHCIASEAVPFASQAGYAVEATLATAAESLIGSEWTEVSCTDSGLWGLPNEGRYELAAFYDKHELSGDNLDIGQRFAWIGIVDLTLFPKLGTTFSVQLPDVELYHEFGDSGSIDKRIVLMVSARRTSLTDSGVYASVLMYDDQTRAWSAITHPDSNDAAYPSFKLLYRKISY